MSYQFMHVELYAPTASKLSGVKRTKKGVVRTGDGIRKNWSAREILAEALREPGAHDHVQAPLPPQELLGNLRGLADELDAFVKPDSQRKDSPILMAGVVSAPWPPGDSRSKAWRNDTLDHLKKEHGANLKVVIAHNDEGHDHLHFYVCTPNFLPIKPIAHAGYKARQAAEAAGEPPKACAEAYEGAMKGLQDRYFLAVAQGHGQARTGPKRRRLGRMEWVEEKRLQELHAVGVANAKKLQEANEAKAAELAVLEQRHKVQSARVVDAAKQVDAGVAQVKQARQDLEKRAATLEKKALELDAKATVLAEKETALAKLSRQLSEQKTKLMDAFALLPAAIQDKLAALFNVKKPEPPAPRPVAPLVSQAGQPYTPQKKRAPGPS